MFVALQLKMVNCIYLMTSSKYNNLLVIVYVSQLIYIARQCQFCNHQKVDTFFVEKDISSYFVCELWELFDLVNYVFTAEKL